MTPLIHELQELAILDAARLQSFYPRVRDRDDVSVLRDPVSDVIVLSSSTHMCLDYYAAKPERAGYAVHGEVVQTPRLADNIRRAEEFGSLLRDKHWLDFGSGLGGMLDEMQGQARWAAGLEPAKERAAIARVKGHTVVCGLEEVAQASLDVVTLFHVLEHLTTPTDTLQQLRTRLRPGGLAVIEVPHARDALLTLFDCEPFKRFTLWSEHLVLHTRQSLKILLEHAGFTNVEVLGRQRYPVTNHLHWLSHGKPGGHEAWSFLDTPDLHTAYEAALARTDRTDTLIAYARAATGACA